MKTRACHLLLIIFSLTIYSCAEELEKDLEGGIEAKTLEFDNLKIGDVMKYSFVTGVHYPSEDSEATYTGDTLELTVVDEVGGKFIIEEEITPSSAVFDSDIKYIYRNEEKYKLVWELREDSIIITVPETEGMFESHLLPYGHRFSLLEETEKMADFDGCHTTIPFHESYGTFFIENGELLDITYPHLNGIINYGPMAFDGDGTTFIYNKENGFVRVTSTSGWTAQVKGWDRIN